MIRLATSVSAYPFHNYRYLKLLKEFAKKFEVYCLAGSIHTVDANRIGDGFRILPVCPVRLPKKIMHLVRPFLSDLWINVLKPDVVWLFDIAVPILPLMFERPVVLDLDDPRITQPGSQTTHVTHNEYRTLHRRKIVTIVVPTELLRTKFIHLGIEPDRIIVVPNGVDTSLFKPMPLPDEPVVLYYGTFQQHRAKLLVEVIEQTCRMDRRVRFLIIGDVPKWFVNRLSRNGLIGSVEMPGFIPHDQLPEWLAKARICLLPQDRSLGGRMPTKLLDYMATGRPIVATDVEESFLVAESGAGLVVPANPKAMAEAIITILQNKKYATEMAQRGVNYARRFDWKIVMEKYTKIIENASVAR